MYRSPLVYQIIFSVTVILCILVLVLYLPSLSRTCRIVSIRETFRGGTGNSNKTMFEVISDFPPSKTLIAEYDVHKAAAATASNVINTGPVKNISDRELKEAQNNIKPYEQQLLETEKNLQEWIDSRIAFQRAEQEKKVNIPSVPNIEIVRIDKAPYDVKQLESMRGSDWLTIAFIEQNSACLNINTWSRKGEYDRGKCAHVDEGAVYMYINNDGCYVHRDPNQAFTTTPVCANVRNFYTISRYYQPAQKVLETPTVDRWLQYTPLRLNSYMQYVNVFDLPSAMRAANVLCNRTPTPCVYNFSPKHYMVELFGSRYQFQTKDIDDEKIWVDEATMKLPWQILIYRPVFVLNRVSNKLYRIRINDGTHRLNETYTTVQLEKASTLIFASNAAASPPNSTVKNSQFTFYSLRLMEIAEQYMGVVSLYFEFNKANFSNIAIPNKGLLRATHADRELKVEYENEARTVHGIFTMPLRFPVEACVFTFFQSAICVYIDAEDGYYFHQAALNNGQVIQTLFMDLFKQYSDSRVVYGIFSVADMLTEEPLQSPYSALSY